MPGWHEATKELQADGRLQMLGLIQEQHPDRCRLFMQWKEMDWPILVDSLDLLEIDVVPLTMAIDEHGVIRHRGLRLRDAASIEETFLDRSYPVPAATAPLAGPVSEPPRPRAGAAGPAWRAYADWRATWSRFSASDSAPAFDSTISAYSQALDENPTDAWSVFRRGVTYRLRYDSRSSRAGDFQRAVDDWTRALELDPNNYIWRRRIQQYGPRLDKPYPFYDWVAQAREQISARGETPVALEVEPAGSEIAEPAGSEIAHPARELSSPAASGESDPEGRIRRDQGPLIDLQVTVVPRRLIPGQPSRFHLVMTPNAELEAHWNNEVDELEIWLDETPGLELGQRRLSAHNPPSPVSSEVRRVETELRAHKDAKPGASTLRGYALYYVCEDVDGVCLYRRQDLAVDIEIVTP